MLKVEVRAVEKSPSVGAFNEEEMEAEQKKMEEKLGKDLKTWAAFTWGRSRTCFRGVHSQR